MLARVLALLLALTLTTALQAEPQRLPIILHCDDAPGTIISMVQDKYGELPFTTGEGVVQLYTGEWLKLEIITTVNPTTGTFSVIGVEPNTSSECMLLAGGKFAPIGTRL